MKLAYTDYLDRIYGGWLGKSMGGAVGMRFEGYKGWIEIEPQEMFPPSVPPNDDLDMQVLWLKVLEEKGLATTADDLAEAWLEYCWYPFNEYGIFRRNWRLGIHPPMSGRFTNQFWETGMGCPIRAEIWGYVFPGAPDLAAYYAGLDGSLDHTEQSIGAEKMFAAMASLAFFIPDVRRLISLTIHYLPADTPIARLTRAAIQAYDQGISLRDAHRRLMMLEGLPEACDAQINVPFTFLGLLYGQNDLQETMLSALRCGYDTDCSLATAAALVGQILGAKRIPQGLKDAIGDELVMGIQYQREEASLSALARDTARLGVLFAPAAGTGVTITDAPVLNPLPHTASPARTVLSVSYHGVPAAAPGDTVKITAQVNGRMPANALLSLNGPEGWTFTPNNIPVTAVNLENVISIHAPAQVDVWPMRNLFQVTLTGSDLAEPLVHEFGITGAGLWQFLGAYYDAVPDEEDRVQKARAFNHHFVSLQRPYLAHEPHFDRRELSAEWSRTLGKPPIVPSYEHGIRPETLIGLRGPYCAYFARTVLSPRERDAYLIVGNTDSYRLYLNGELVAEIEECLSWTPFNNAHPVTLREGDNELVVKLLKRSDNFRFTLGIRERQNLYGYGFGPNKQDWVVDVRDRVPQQ